MSNKMTLCINCQDQIPELSSVVEIRKFIQAQLKELDVQLLTNIGICKSCGQAWELSKSEIINNQAMKNIID